MNWSWPLGNIGKQAADSKGGAGLMIWSPFSNALIFWMTWMVEIACSNGLQSKQSSGFQRFKIDVRQLLNKKCLEPCGRESTPF